MGRIAKAGSAAKKLIEQVRQRAWQNRNGLYVPRVEGDRKLSTWPVCMTCNRDVDRVNVEDIGTNSVTIRAWCHGQECAIKMNFPYRIQKRDEEEVMGHVREAIVNCTFFDPSIA